MKRSLLLLVAGSLLLALLLLFDVIPFLRGGFGWQWGYAPASLLRVLPMAAALLLYGCGAIWLIRRQADGLLHLWSIAGVVVLTLAALHVRSSNVLYELFIRTASGLVTGPHMAAAQIDWANWLDWPQTVAAFEGHSVHVLQSGPGLPLLYAALNSTLESLPSLSAAMQQALLLYQCHNFNLLSYTPGQWASAWFGVLMPLWAALAVLPLYAIAKKLGSPSVARRAVFWWALVPALLVFAPTWNTLFPLFALLAFWFLLRGLDGGPGWLIAAGLVAGLLIFANYAPVPLLGFFGVYALLRFRNQLGRAVVVGLWFGLGLALPWLLYWLASGLTPLDLLNFAMSSHLDLERPYLPWLWLHFWEWALLTGIPLILLWLWLAFKRHLETPVATMALALAVAMGVLLLSGAARGETGRVWLFFAPFVLIAAAAAVERFDSGWLMISGAQAILLLVLVGTWGFIEDVSMQPPPDRPGPVNANRIAEADFGGLFTLDSWDAEPDGDDLLLSLNWEAQQSMTTPYWFAALLVAPDGTIPYPAVIWQPVETRYPTTCWSVAETVGDDVAVPLPDNPSAGGWWLSLSVFADETQAENRLAVTLGDGSVDNQIGLGPIELPQSAP